MKNQTEAIKYYAPGQYLVTLVSKQTETDVIDEFLGWDGDRPIYGGCEFTYKPTYHIPVVIDKFVSEFGVKLRACCKLTREGVKNRVCNFDSIIKPCPVASEF